MNTELMRFLGERVRIRKDISHQEYDVLGIVWSNDIIIISDGIKYFAVHYNELDIIPSNKEE